MSKFFDRLFTVIDKTAEAGARKTAMQTGRRSFLAKAGVALAGTMAMPLLPFDRSLGGLAMAATGAGSDVNDEYSCDYWRHCALDGNLCSTSGGTMTSCPPGSEASKVAWVGTCRNPNDGKAYLVSSTGGQLHLLLPQRARASRLPHGSAQRHQLVHGQHQQGLPLHGVGGGGAGRCVIWL